jgi:hypothetical protein
VSGTAARNVRVVVVWLLVLAALFFLQEYFS